MALRALQGPTGGGAPVGGGGTSSPSTIPRWTGPSTLGDSALVQSGTVIAGATLTGFGVGIASPTSVLHVVAQAGTGLVPVARFKSEYAAVATIGTGSTDAFFGVAGTTGYETCWNVNTANYLSARVNNAEALRITNSGNVGIGTASPTAGRSLTTAADVDIFGVRVGRGAGAVSSNTAVGASALNANTTGTDNTVVGANALASNTTGSTNTAVGAYAGYRHTVNTAVAYVGYAAGRYQTGGLNTAFGYQALLGVDGSSSGASNTAIGNESLVALTSGASNTAVGRQSGLVLTSGGFNVLLGLGAGNTITTGSQNICLGANATTAVATDSNQLVVGSAGQYVATNGGATTYYATAGASLGYIQVRLNGANVKIQVFAP